MSDHVCQTCHREYEDTLRVQFLEMIFALAIGDVAIHAAEFFECHPYPPFDDTMHIFSHLSLGLFLVAASWVGWRNSVSPLNRQAADLIKIREIFSIKFATLVLDVLIVILYFLLIRSVEVENKAGVCRLTHPTAEPEARWLMVVFCVYAVWDQLTDIFNQKCKQDWWNDRFDWKVFLAMPVSSFASIVSALLAYVVMVKAPGDQFDSVQVACFDVSLIALVFLFRLLKFFEWPLAKLLRVSHFQAFERRTMLLRHDFAIVVCGLLYVGGLYGGLYL